MHIPRTKIGSWAAGLIQECLPDLEERIQRGSLYRNLYLTGDENGNPVTYPKTFSYIDNLASFLFSPLELRFNLRFHGGGTLTQRAMGRVATAEMHQMMSDAGVYDMVSDAVEWSLIKGKTFIKLNWEGDGFAPYMVQPEFMGVLRPDVTELDRQPAFVHSTYYTPSEFAHAFRGLPNLRELMRDIGKRGQVGRPDERPERANALKQIVLGGLNPFQQAGNSPAQLSSRGIVNWLGGPTATFDPKIMAQLIRLDELWVKDSATDDWATFQVVGDVVVTGEQVIRNAFADMFDPNNPMRRLPEKFRAENPLRGMHNFIEFCPNHLSGYFWGRSECCNIGVVQMQLNARLDGILRLLRRQEKPPRFFTGTTGMARDKYSAMDMPGGFYVDPSPTAKMNELYPHLPEGLWESVHELEAMFNDMSGLPPVLRGQGDSGVRAQGHAQVLTRNASPRFQDRALKVERSVADIGGLALAMLRAMDDRDMIAWLEPGSANLVANLPPDRPELEAPAPGMKQYPFRWAHIDGTVKVQVDSHSSSPVFGNDTRELLFNMARLGVVSPEELLEHIHPPGEEDMVADLERKKIAQQQLIAQHPELLYAGKGKGKK